MLSHLLSFGVRKIVTSGQRVQLLWRPTKCGPSELPESRAFAASVKPFSRGRWRFLSPCESTELASITSLSGRDNRGDLGRIVRPDMVC